MRVPYSALRYFLIFFVLAFLALPVPVASAQYVDTSGIISAINTNTSTLTMNNAKLEELIKQLNVGNIKAQQAAAKNAQDVANFGATVQDSTGKKIVQGVANIFNQPPPKYAAAVAGDMQWDVYDLVAQRVMRQSFLSALADRHARPDAGSVITNKILLDAACEIGMIGPVRYGKQGCDKPLVPEVAGCDISPAICILNNPRIYFDKAGWDDEMKALAKATPQAPYQLVNPKNRGIMGAYIALAKRHNSGQESYPQGQMMTTSAGISDAAEMSDMVNLNSSSLGALLMVLSYHIAPSTAMVPNCATSTQFVQQYLQKLDPNIIPEAGYCPSRVAKDEAALVRDWTEITNVGDLGGRQIEQASFVADVSNAVENRRLAYANVVIAASGAASNDNQGAIGGKSGLRPVDEKKTITQNEQLIDAIKQLTKAVQAMPKAGDMAVQEVSVKRDPGSGIRDQKKEESHKPEVLNIKHEANQPVLAIEN
jgi:hypothetical protein